MTNHKSVALRALILIVIFTVICRDSVPSCYDRNFASAV